MSNIQKQNSNAVATGSLQDIAAKSGLTLAEAFMSCDAITLIDTSGSMGICDVQPLGGVSRYMAACVELKRLQSELPGKIAVISFSDRAEFCPSGVPTNLMAGTNMQDALVFIKMADGTGIRLILISDGQPDDRDGALRIARTFTSRIDVIYIGPPDGEGERFLAELANCTGGVLVKTGAAEIEKSTRLLLGGVV